MSYILERFGTVTLPFLNPVGDAGTGPSRNPLVEVPGGWFDALGGEQAPRAQTTITKKGTITAATAAALQSTFAALRAMRGKRDKLYRRQPDGTVEWTRARLMQIAGEKIYRQKNIYIDLDLTFLMIDPIWYGASHGDGWLLDSGEYLDVGLMLDENDTLFDITAGAVTPIVLNNGGNAAVRNIILTLAHSGGGNIEQLSVVNATNGSYFAWSNNLPAGDDLVIDCGAMSVEADGVDAYAYFVLHATHSITEWLRLEPGDNSLTVTVGGATATGITLAFDYSDGWE